jgi:hypothetical protein
LRIETAEPGDGRRRPEIAERGHRLGDLQHHRVGAAHATQHGVAESRAGHQRPSGGWLRGAVGEVLGQGMHQRRPATAESSAVRRDPARHLDAEVVLEDGGDSFFRQRLEIQPGAVRHFEDLGPQNVADAFVPDLRTIGQDDRYWHVGFLPYEGEQVAH